MTIYINILILCIISFCVHVITACQIKLLHKKIDYFDRQLINLQMKVNQMR